MPPTRSTRSTTQRQEAVEAQTTGAIPELTELNSLILNDLRALCKKQALTTAGTKDCLRRRLNYARQSQESRKHSSQKTQNGGNLVVTEKHADPPRENNASSPFNKSLAPTLSTEVTNLPPDIIAGEKNKLDKFVSPVSVPSLKKSLLGHPDQLFVDKLCSELTHGAHIGYSGPRYPRFCKQFAYCF
jgi:hypothetical protein